MRVVATVSFLATLFAASFALAQTAAEEQACKADFKKYCSGVVPGGGRVIACLEKQKDKLSPECQKVVETYGK